MITARGFEGEEDFWRVRALIVATTPITPVGLNWEVRRWDGQRFHHPTGAMTPTFMARIQLWEDDGQLVGAVHPEDGGDAHLQLHPDYRHIEEEMLLWAEEHLAQAHEDSPSRTLDVVARAYDARRQRLLTDHGYTKTEWVDVMRHLRLGQQPLETPHVAADYQIRTTRPQELAECQGIADLLNAAFGRTTHTAAECEAFTRLAPSFRGDLDLVAVAPNGAIAAYVGVAYDEENRLGIFEPVCTHPNHLRHGLARALMQEGLLRLRALGARNVVVSTGDMVPANRLYDTIGFTEAYRGFVWRKEYHLRTTA